MNAPFLDPESALQRRKQARVRALIVRWHRWVGITAAALTILLSITGIMLSHAERLKLHERAIAPAVAEVFYDVAPTVSPVGAETTAGWLVWVDGSLYLDGNPLQQAISTFNGVVKSGEFLVVAGDSDLLLFTLEGKFVERMNGAILPAAPDRISARPDGGLLLEGAGNHYLSTPDLLEWSALDLDGMPIIWSTPTTALPRHVEATALKQHGVGEISNHRFVSDLHSGRLFGSFGPLIMDLAAILLVLLSLSGFYMWWRQRSARLKKMPGMPKPD
jgi:hypothetical protein